MSAKHRTTRIALSSKILYVQYRILCLHTKKNEKKWKSSIGLNGYHYSGNTSIGVNYSGTVSFVMRTCFNFWFGITEEDWERSSTNITILSTLKRCGLNIFPNKWSTTSAYICHGISTSEHLIGVEKLLEHEFLLDLRS